MRDRFRLNPKSYALKYFIHSINEVLACLTADNRSRLNVSYPKYKMAAAFIRNGYAVLIKFISIKSGLCFFKFKNLRLSWSVSPEVYLSDRHWHL